MFKIGQKVVYITGIHMEKGTICVVSDVEQNPCGCTDIAINGEKIIRNPVFGGGIRCSDCGSVYEKNYVVRGNNWNAHSFRPLDESFAEGIIEMIEKSIEEELVNY